ncbi:MAG: M18 family aminopeptidase [Deltaproteobacteria bacterium]|nr:M18 family aminopeptidase [Deltaproteobacteria bacterium]MBW2360256.1 M18 family aminopeptidase [Deltaproteobacteria bacterium]
MADAVADLLSFIDRSPTPYHAVAEAVRRLEVAGWSAASEADVWELSPGDRRYVVRGEGSLVAFEVGSAAPAETGFRIVGAHTDSPNLRLKPRPDLAPHGYRQLGVEPYGSALLHTWLDRDLSVAGRVTFREGDAARTVLLDFGRPLLRVPNLAIHLNRGIRQEGLKLNPQQHLVPVTGLEDAPPFAELVVSELRAQGVANPESDALLGFDLMAYDVQPPAVIGVRGEFITAPRIDNLASCHAGLSALIDAPASPSASRVVVLYDHEEVGSRSAQGAAGPLLADLLERIVDSTKGGEMQALHRALASSCLVSADMAHAIHPNYADKHEPQHRPVVGGGPVLKSNVNQAYASDARTGGLFELLCHRVGVTPQHFVSRSDLACGSTIGPISAARVGVPTVDVGNPMLSMHSCREMAGTADVQPMIDVLCSFFDA